MEVSKNCIPTVKVQVLIVYRRETDGKNNARETKELDEQKTGKKTTTHEYKSPSLIASFTNLLQ